MKFKPGIYKVGDTNSAESAMLQFVRKRKIQTLSGVTIFAGIFTIGIARNFSDRKMFLGIFLVFAILVVCLYLLNKNTKDTINAFKYSWFQVFDDEIVFYDLKDGKKINVRKISDIDSVKVFPHIPSGGFQIEVPRFKIFSAIKKVEIIVISDNENRAKSRLEEISYLR